MAASKYDFKIEQGSSFKFALVYKDADANPVDLTGWCARLTWKTNSGLTQAFSTENLDYSLYKFTLDGPNGKLTLLLPSATTNDFNFLSAKYDLELSSPDDIYSGGGKYSIRILYGVISILKRNSQGNTVLDCST